MISVQDIKWASNKARGCYFSWRLEGFSEEVLLPGLRMARCQSEGAGDQPQRTGTGVQWPGQARVCVSASCKGPCVRGEQVDEKGEEAESS